MPTVMQWCVYLLDRIEQQTLYADPYESRYVNEYVLPFIMREYREVYGSSVDTITPDLQPPRSGTAAIGIDALVERLTVQGAVSEDASVTKLVQDAWEASDLDVMHREAHREALIKARSYAFLTRSTDNRAVIGIESPEQMAVHRMQVPPYDVDAALKVQVDEWTGKRFGRLALPGRDIDVVEQDAPVADPEGSNLMSRWVVKKETPSRLLGVPAVEFASRPRLLADPVSEIEPIATLVDTVDLIEGLMVFAGHFGAVPIRTISGLVYVPDLVKDPSGKTPLLDANNKPVTGFNPRADHVWGSTDPATKFAQLEPADLTTFVVWAEHAASKVRAKTSIASTYYSMDLKSHMSAELLKTDEAPMVRRVLSMGRDGSFGQAWRRVDEMILQIEAPGNRAKVKPRWADPETRVEAQAVDSFQKAVASGIGVRAAAEKFLGWDPDFINRAVTEAENASRDAAMMAEQFAATTGAPGAAPTTIGVAAA